MGCGWGYGNYRSEKQREGPVLFFSIVDLFYCYSFLDFSGGILGWDPVLTICIFCEMSYKISIKLS
jgi:hypothetical protein